MHPKYAFFDVDGTVISRDSFMLMLNHCIRHQPWRAGFLAIFAPVFLWTHFFHIDKRWAKSCVLWTCTVFRTKRGSVRFLHKFVETCIQPYWFHEVAAELVRLRQENISICYVSASGQFWLRHILNRMDPGPKLVIGSRLGFFAGGVVMKSKNCYGDEKIRRINERLGESITWHSGYSDHSADIPMLKRCATRSIISPKPRCLTKFNDVFGNTYTLHTWTSTKSLPLKKGLEKRSFLKRAIKPKSSRLKK